jgi:hypothetical protein
MPKAKSAKKKTASKQEAPREEAAPRGEKVPRTDGNRPPTREERAESVTVPETTTVFADDSGSPLWLCEHVQSPQNGPCNTCVRQRRITEKTQDFVLLAGLASQHAAAHPDQAENYKRAARTAVEYANDYIDRRPRQLPA